MIAVPTTASYLQRVIKMIGDEDWSGMDVDIKGAIYEGLLEKTASSSDKGAGKHFCLPSSGSAESLRQSSFCFAANAAGQSLKTNPLANKDLDDFKAVYHPGAFAKRKETERFKKFTYAEIVARDKAKLDILWLKDDSLEDSDKLPAPALLAAEIVESLEAALEEFRAVEEALAPSAE
jgi:hypothetical protein